MVVAKQLSEEKYGVNNYADNTGFVSQEKFSNDQTEELEDRSSFLPAPHRCTDTSSLQERSTAPMGPYRLGIFSKSSSSKINSHVKNTNFVSQKKFSKDQVAELEARFSLTPATESLKTSKKIVDIHPGINVDITLREFHIIMLKAKFKVLMI